MDGHNTEEDKRIEILKDKQWEAQDDLMIELNDSGAQEFFSLEKISELSSAFLEEKEHCRCIDEGTVHMNNQKDSLFIAGSGILFPAGSYDERLVKVAKLFLKQEVQTVTSHEGCGAAGIAWNTLTESEKAELQQEGVNDSDQYGKKWSMDLQAKMNELKDDNMKDIKHEYIFNREMSRSKEFHNARTVYFDLTGEFNPGKLGDVVPKGFVVDYGDVVSSNEDNEVQNYPFAELRVTFSIAFGDHGFGNRFTKDNPFIVVIISSSEKELEVIKERIESKELPEEHKDNIKVDGFVFKGR